MKWPSRCQGETGQKKRVTFLTHLKKSEWLPKWKKQAAENILHYSKLHRPNQKNILIVVLVLPCQRSSRTLRWALPAVLVCLVESARTQLKPCSNLPLDFYSDVRQVLRFFGCTTSCVSSCSKFCFLCFFLYLLRYPFFPISPLSCPHRHWLEKLPDQNMLCMLCKINLTTKRTLVNRTVKGEYGWWSVSPGLVQGIKLQNNDVRMIHKKIFSICRK